MGEETFFQDQWATVTSREVRAGQASYQVSAISSVATRHDPRPERALWIGLITGTIAAGPWVYLWLTGANDFFVAFLLLIFGAGSAFFGIASLVNLWRYVSHQPKTWVQIGVGGIPTDLIWSPDDAWAKRLAEAIRQALAAR